MRIVCTVAIGNRSHSALAVKSQNKHVRSTLALCKHPKDENEFMILHFTAQNKTGTKYKLSNNIKGVLTRFLNEGKATIQFKEPPHDLFIQADHIQLKGFLHLLKRAIEKKISAKELTVSSMSVGAIPQKNIAPKKLVIKKRSELPIKGYPRTLETLFINEIELCKLTIGILQLSKLQVLDVSDNLIEYLPNELKNLPLVTLNVSKNSLYKSTLKQWGWIGGTLQKTLRSINLSNNDLYYIPEIFVKLDNLITINLNNNRLNQLPAGFGNLRNLRNFSVANNSLTQFPGSMRRLHLEHLNISENNFKPINVAAIYPKSLPVCTLKESAARKVLHARLSYTPEDLPLNLIDYLDNAHYCVCGRACFEVHLHHANVLMLGAITQTYVGTLGDSDYVPIDCFYCSLRCFRRTTFNLNSMANAM